MVFKKKNDAAKDPRRRLIIGVIVAGEGDVLKHRSDEISTSRGASDFPRFFQGGVRQGQAQTE